jgi:O-antigen ligase
MPDWVPTAVIGGLFVFMLVQPRGFVATVLVLAAMLAGGLAVLAGQRQLSLVAVATLVLAVGASLVTLLGLPAIPESEPWDRLGQPWLMLITGLAGYELLRRGDLRLPGWAPPAGLLVLLVAWLAMIGLSEGVAALEEGTNLAKLSLIGHAFAKTLFLATPAAWLLVALWYRATGRRLVLWALALPLAMAVTSPSQSLSLGVVLGLLVALLAGRPAVGGLLSALILLIPVAAVVVMPPLMAHGLHLPENWSWRVELWNEGLRFALDRPLTGWGLQSYRELRDTLMELHRINHAHSVAVEFLLDFGVWGLGGIAALAATAGIAVRRWGRTLGARLLVLPPLIAWLTIVTISLGLWTDFVFGGTLFVMVLVLARVAPEARLAGYVRGTRP